MTALYSTLSGSQLQERASFCRAYANTMLLMAKLYQEQGDREESMRQCANHGIICIREIKRIETYIQAINNEVTNVIEMPVRSSVKWVA
jgi:hypothetical protein